MTSATGSAGAVTFEYNDRGQLTRTDGAAGTSSFTYNPDGQMATRADAAGTTSYQYDDAGRLATMANDDAKLSASLTYNSLSQVKAIGYGAGGNARCLSYDDQHRVTGDELKTTSGATVGKIEYGYDANGNEVLKKTTGFAGSTTNTYTYDLADRLTTWNDGTSTTVYAYDKSGNRVQAGTKTFTYDERNQLVNQTDGANGTTYSYSPRGTLRRAGTGGTAMETKADAFNQVVSQDSKSAGTRTYGYDGLGRVMLPGFSYSGSGNTLASDGSAGYLRDPDDDLFGINWAGASRVAWTDQHDDVVGQFAPSAPSLGGSTTYDPLGKVLATNGMWGSLGYQSEWTDEFTGRVNMMARWYNTDTGQFDTRDAASVSPTPASVEANRFAYADDNPLTNTDPTGYWSISGAWNKVKSTARSVTSAVTSYVSSAYSYASSAYSYASYYGSRAYNAAKTTAKKAVNTVKRTAKRAYHAAKNTAKRVYHAAKKYAKKAYKAAKKAVDKGRKWVANKAHKMAQKVKKAVNKVKQAGKKALARANRIAKSVGNAVKDAAKATGKWVKDHKDLLIEVAAIGAGIVAGLACTAATAGTAVMACMVGTAAIINVAKDYAQGDIHGVGDLLTSAGTGAFQGLLGGAAGAIGGRVAGAVAGKLGGAAASLGGRMFTGGVAAGVEDGIMQFATTGRVDMGGLAMSVGMGAALGGLGRGARGPSRSRPPAKSEAPEAVPGRRDSDAGSGGSCPWPRHSFAPSTRVVMADGSTRAIKDVNVGDKVVATNPVTGRTAARAVTMLHANVDRDLTDVTVTITAAGSRTPSSVASAAGSSSVASFAAVSVGAASAAVAFVGPSAAGVTGSGAATSSGAPSAGPAPTSSSAFGRGSGRLAGRLAAVVVAAGLALGASAVVHTTAHHPFWDESAGRWVSAAQLPVGHRLRTLDGAVATVTTVVTRTGAQVMRDLTVDSTHTYYVIAGTTPVLVHNCDPGSAAKLRDALNNAGDLEPSTPHSPHHIVAGNSPKAAPARAQLDRFGIGVNDAENGVWLPRSSSSPNPNGASVHSRVHTNEYYDYVNHLMDGARSRSEALDVINHVRGQLLGGYWP